MTKLYGHARNLHTLEPHYSAHVSAMTTEALHGKGEIAAELAWRDARIQRLTEALENELRNARGAVDSAEPRSWQLDAALDRFRRIREALSTDGAGKG